MGLVVIHTKHTKNTIRLDFFFFYQIWTQIGNYAIFNILVCFETKQNLLKKLSKYRQGARRIICISIAILMDFLTAFCDVALRPGYRIRVRALPCRDLSVS